MEFIRSRCDWLRELEKCSSVAAGLKLSASLPDENYSIKGSHEYANVDAFSLGNSGHNLIIGETIDKVSAIGVNDKVVRDLLKNLTHRNTYGTFAELMGYRTMLATGCLSSVQHHFKGTEILNPNGADLDGVINLDGLVAFDIKAFGLTENIVKRLTARLSEDIPGKFIAVSGTNALSVSELNKLIGSDYNILLSDLIAFGESDKHGLILEVRDPNPVQFTEKEIDPLNLARYNAAHAFNYAKQFTKNIPFVLTFVAHPWWSGLVLTNKFNGVGEAFQRELARATFMDFVKDLTIVPKTNQNTRASVLPYLSALFLLMHGKGKTHPRCAIVSF